jgi:ubiquinone biosynthesis protein
MVNWDFLIDEAALASVLPQEYSHLCRPVAGALAVFLGGLPGGHQTAILEEQAALAPRATTAERLATLARSCPALHKLGQILARDRRLSHELRRHLQELESLPPSITTETIQEILADELGPLDRLGITLQPPALAEASVAVVIPFRYDHPPGGTSLTEGVFKVLKPGIEERLEQELALLERVGAYLDEGCDEFGIPHLDYQDAFEQVRGKLRHEVRLDQEQRQLAAARIAYQGQPRVQIPMLLEPCSPRVTAMERIFGVKVTDHALTAGRDVRRLAELIVDALIARPIFATTAEALFHGDPHAGNLFLTTDNRLAILDWSLVGSLRDCERAAMMQIILAALALDEGRIVTLLEGLAARQDPDEEALVAVVRRWLGRVCQGQFPGFTWLMGLLDEAAQSARLRVSGDLLLFRKSLHTLEGLLADVRPEGRQIDAVLSREFVRQFAIEWPGRWLARPESRSFPTRLSNADLLQFALDFPWSVARFWLGPAAATVGL